MPREAIVSCEEESRLMLARFMAAFLLLASAAAAAKQPPPVAFQGVITQIQGAVEVVGPGVSDLPLASPWQVIQAGVTIRIPKGGSAGIVCSNRRFVRLRGPAAWSLTEPACAAGKELTPAEYALTVPQGGRFKVVKGLLVLEREIRDADGDDPLAPVVLSPRSTVLRSPRPTLSWSRVPAATEYEVQWSGRGTDNHDLRLATVDVPCARALESLSICWLPWPEDQPDLPPGEVFFLRIAARGGVAEPWHANDPVEVRTQRIVEAVALERQFRAVESLGFEGAALDVARAGLLAENGLYGDAVELYRGALGVSPTPELRVTIADVELVLGLHLLAEPRYREALAAGVPSVRAAAAFGLGRIAYTRGNFQDAAALFRQARELYSHLRLGEEEAAAFQAEEKAAARVQK